MVGLMEVYFIATYRDIKRNEQGWLDTGGGRRVVGFYHMFEQADKAVRENWDDIYENGYYKYAVIECCEEGLYPFCTKPIFYKWGLKKEFFRYFS